jgi:hypothetical protein
MPAGARFFATVLLAISSLLLLGCASGSIPAPPGAPPSPVPSDPWYGTVGNVLISDRGVDQDGVIDYLWIGFNSSQNWQNFSTLHQQGHLGWIGGRVVVDAKNPLGFYFDPNTTVGAEVTAETFQTGLDAIKKNPAQFANGQNWYVTPSIEKIQ